MLPFKKSSQILATVLGLGFGLTLPAQAEVWVNVCHGEARILSQQQTGTDITMEVEVNIADCNGVCIGSLEYDLLLVDADAKEIKWHMTETWEWREMEAGTFTLSLQQQALPNTTLKEVNAMEIGRCSCSTDQKIQ